MFFAVDEEDVDHGGADRLVLEHLVARTSPDDVLKNKQESTNAGPRSRARFEDHKWSFCLRPSAQDQGIT